MLYLVNCEVAEWPYGGGYSNSYETSHIVEANNEEEVHQKVQNYYESKTIPYSVRYSVAINYVNECIV